METMKMMKTKNKFDPININHLNLIQELQRTILNAREKPSTELKNNFVILL